MIDSVHKLGIGEDDLVAVFRPVGFKTVRRSGNCDKTDRYFEGSLPLPWTCQDLS